MSPTVQQTIDGREAEKDRTRPSTFMWCPDTQQWILRTKRFDWPNELYESKEAFVEYLNDTIEGDDELKDDESGEPERLGNWYDVTISVSTEYRFNIPAWGEHEAKDLAEEWHWDASPADAFVVHTETREGKEITSEDVPDDFDPYGGDLLWEVFSDD